MTIWAAFMVGFIVVFFPNLQHSLGVAPPSNHQDDITCFVPGIRASTFCHWDARKRGRRRPTIYPDAPWEVEYVTFIYHTFTYAIQAGKYTQKVPWIMSGCNQKSGKQLTSWGKLVVEIPWFTARWWQLKYLFIFTPILGKWPNFDKHIFQMGWFNHQLDRLLHIPGGDHNDTPIRGRRPVHPRRWPTLPSGGPPLGSCFFFFSAGGVGGSFACVYVVVFSKIPVNQLDTLPETNIAPEKGWLED